MQISDFINPQEIILTRFQIDANQNPQIVAAGVRRLKFQKGGDQSFLTSAASILHKAGELARRHPNDYIKSALCLNVKASIFGQASRRMKSMTRIYSRLAPLLVL